MPLPEDAPAPKPGDLFDLENMLVAKESSVSSPALSFQEIRDAFYADYHKVSSVLDSLSQGNLTLSIPICTNVDSFFEAPIWIEKEEGERAMAFLININGRDSSISFNVKNDPTAHFDFSEWDKARGYIRTLVQYALEREMRAAFQQKLLEADSNQPVDQAEDLSLL